MVSMRHLGQIALEYILASARIPLTTLRSHTPSAYNVQSVKSWTESKK